MAREGPARGGQEVHERNGTSTTPITAVDAPDVVWSADFQFDSSGHGRMFNITSMVDEHTRGSILDLTERSTAGEDFVNALDAIITARGALGFVRCDNGPEQTAADPRDWCRFSGAGAASSTPAPPYVDPGSLRQNAYIEAFNARLCDEVHSR